MNILNSEKNHGSLKVTIQVSKEEFDEARLNAYRNCAENYPVPGKPATEADLSELKRLYGPAVLYDEALAELVPQAFGTYLNENGTRILGKPRAEDIEFLDDGSVQFTVVSDFVVVGAIEEGAKYWLMARKTWRNPSFNCRFDGVVYAVTLSLGFALWENIQYVLRFGFLTAMARAVTAVPGHACFGVFMGAWYGSAKRWQQKGRVGRSRFSRWMAVLVPVLLHGLYDTIAADPTANTGWLFLPFVLLLFTSTLYLVRRSARNDAYL